jgi:hypothetical protein
VNRILILVVLALAGLGASRVEAQVFRPRSKAGISHPMMTPIVASTAVAAKGPTTTPPKAVPVPTRTPVAKAKTPTTQTTKTAAKKGPRRVVKKKGNGDDDDEVVVVDDDDE